MARFKSVFSLVLSGALMLGVSAQAASKSSDQEIQNKVTTKLQSKAEFSGVSSSVSDGVVTLRGSVDSFKAKVDAEKQARKASKSKNVNDLLQVAGPSVADKQLQEQLSKKLRYDRVGLGFSNVFNVITLGVNEGVVTVAGEVRTPYDHDSALQIAQNQKGVKGVIDNLKVSPTSIYDDDLRIRTARAIYRDPFLSKYGMDPQAPIRILVDGGHIGLYGTVNSQADKTVAGMRARQVFGAFSVENHLETAQNVNE